MKKRYQVFLSSTYKDLIEERQQVTTALMKMNCIPAGMELFPAIDLEQFEFIKKIIDDSDYYFIMVAGKYGSISPETGLSYTEMEYDYAVEKGLKIIALVYRDINKLTREKTETDPDIAEKLESFRQKISNARLINFWSNLTELPGYVAISLSQTMTMFPAEGWIRARNAASEEMLIDINRLRKENDELKEKFPTQAPVIKNLAELTSTYNLTGTYSYAQQGRITTNNWSISCSWAEIFSMIAPSLLSLKSDNDIRDSITRNVVKTATGSPQINPKIDDGVFSVIKVQMMAYNLVDIIASNTGRADYWKLTPLGHQKMLELMSVKA
ncbi:Uncharacterised protein [Serratia quinivorans]|uniref:DUF4062 domain-containing protein n=1 Tax=Serratia quinivorans TaxID=137545 RepID=UPI00217A573C|nr:DUF4062 domain-containing protein [Serratia quinivorans]CAI0849038.1 Uncharacterised protein [Serratia quinivorans]CAI0887614.1 Uncharacterised protein [Serratia quinivorans]CAI1678602.1 Uncharacterised protein [Serratia quinivorans]CAI2079865.1 Uncharacterised protein [Serratia quinivorans]CAI2439394.1 Uncharacterised protein [Serratia quinivorans]